MDNYSSYIQMLRKNLKRRLPAMRYEHSLSVSFTCMALAMRYGTDLNQAEVAGLLHDCGKRFSDDIILKKCQKPLSDYRSRNFKRDWLPYYRETWHGDSGQDSLYSGLH